MTRSLIVFAFLAVASACSADTLDFTEFGTSGIIEGQVHNLSNAQLTSFGPDLFVGAPFLFGEDNGLGIACGAALDGSCEADWQIDFFLPLIDLRMSSFGVSAGDQVEVFAFNGGSQVGSLVVTTNDAFDLTSFGQLDRLLFIDSSTSSGIGWGDFEFTTVPEPSACSCLLLFGFFLTQRRRESGRSPL